MGCGHFFSGITILLQVGVAVAVLVLTLQKLDNYDISISFDSAQVTNECLLGETSNGVNLCIYSYTVAGVSIAATIILGILTCVTCNLCGLGSVLDAIFSALGTAWWAVAGVVLNHYSNQPPTSNLPQGNWRKTIIILAFVATGLFALTLLIAFIRMFSKCCSCCSGGSRSDRRRSRDMEAGPTKVVVVQSAAPVVAAPAGKVPPGGQFIVDNRGAPSPYWNTNASRY